MTESKKKILTAVLVASVGLLGVIIGAFINRGSQIEIEAIKLNNSIILNALETNDKEVKIKNLQFYMESGILDAKGLQKVITDYANKKEKEQLDKSYSNLEVSLVVDKNTLSIGEYMKSRVICNNDCYVNIYHINSKKEASLIYPLEDEKNYLKANRDLLLPKLQATTPVGFDTLIALASQKEYKLRDKSLLLNDYSAEELIEKIGGEKGNFSVSTQIFSINPKGKLTAEMIRVNK